MDDKPFRKVTVWDKTKYLRILNRLDRLGKMKEPDDPFKRMGNPEIAWLNASGR